MNNESWKWDAEAAFKRDEIRLSLSEARERAWASCTCDPLDLEAGMANDDCAVHSRALDYDGSETRTPRHGWTPAPTKPAYSQTNVNLEHKGRDYEALRRAAFEPGSTPEHPIPKREVGYWEDAPRGMKFVAKPTRGDLEEDCFSNESDAVAACRTGEHVEKMPDGTFAIYPDSTCPKCGNMMVAGHYCSTGGAKFGGGGGKPTTASQKAAQTTPQGPAREPSAAPTTTPPADGLFEPVGTMPVVGDRFNYGGAVCTVTRIDHTREFAVRFIHSSGCEDGLMISYFTDKDKNPLRILKRPTKPRDDVATGARVWTGSNRCVRVWVGGADDDSRRG